MSNIAAPVGRTRAVAVALAVAAVVTAQRASMQTPQPSWAGWARCQVDMQGPGYTERQIHTWTSSGGAPRVEGAFRVYDGTWSVVGGGSLQRTQGTQTLVAQWAINGASADAPLAMFVRASDGRTLIQARHAQLRSPGAVAGYQQQIIDGTPQSPGQISGEGFEWSFPVIGAPAADKAVSGSSAPAVNGSVGYMQPGGSRGTASCQWTFGQGTAAPAPPLALAAVPVPSAPASVNAAGPAVPAQPAQAPPGAGGAGQVPPSVAIALPPGIPTLVVPSQPAVVAVPAAIPTAVPPPVATALEAAIPSATAKPPADRAGPPRQFTENEQLRLQGRRGEALLRLPQDRRRTQGQPDVDRDLGVGVWTKRHQEHTQACDDRHALAARQARLRRQADTHAVLRSEQEASCRRHGVASSRVIIQASALNQTAR